MSEIRTISQWLNQAQHKLASVELASAKIDAELLLAHTLGQERHYLASHAKDVLPRDDQAKADALIARRLDNEPIAYLTRHKEFYGFDFLTDARALIPRGESEVLVESAVQWLRKHSQKQIIAEIGTGSGAIILSLAKYFPKHTFLATEISQEALNLAQANAKRIEVNTISWFTGNLAEPLLSQHAGQINLLIANLPYIPSALLVSLDPTIHYYEPHIALDGGDDGLALYRRFLPQAKELLAPKGLLLCEHEYDQGQAMRRLAKETFPASTVETLKDYLGHERALHCQTK